MDRITAIARKYGLLVVEDAAQGVNSFFAGQALGSIGDLGAYSFHKTKNYISGEGGALASIGPSWSNGPRSSVTRGPTARSSSAAWSTSTRGSTSAPPTSPARSSAPFSMASSR